MLTLPGSDEVPDLAQVEGGGRTGSQLWGSGPFKGLLGGGEVLGMVQQQPTSQQICEKDIYPTKWRMFHGCFIFFWWGVLETWHVFKLFLTSNCF